MKPSWLFILVVIIIVSSMIVIGGVVLRRHYPVRADDTPISNGRIILPTAAHDSSTSIEEAMQQRRSVRSYRQEALSLVEIAQLLWAAQGVTHPDGYRTVPSAGALYPLEIFLVCGNVTDISPGVYRYVPNHHTLELWLAGDKRNELYDAALRQDAVKTGAATLVIAAVFERTSIKYGDRGVRYVHMEVGHAAQNVYLQAVSLNLGTVFIGAFFDEQVKQILHLEDDMIPLGLMPVGRTSANETND